jgi:hypothetical protein
LLHLIAEDDTFLEPRIADEGRGRGNRGGPRRLGALRHTAAR